MIQEHFEPRCDGHHNPLISVREAGRLLVFAQVRVACENRGQVFFHRLRHRGFDDATDEHDSPPFERKLSCALHRKEIQRHFERTATE